VDYLGVELAYLEALARREAASRASRHAGRAARWHDRQRRFLAEHLGPWFPVYARQAAESARTDFYRGYLLILVGFVEEQLQILSS
jgi:TorA maturation chaperone TorD